MTFEGPAPLEPDPPRESLLDLDQWQKTACVHEDMLFTHDDVGSWSQVQAFREALTALGTDRVALLLGALPHANGGTTSPDVAKGAIKELDDFERAYPGEFGYVVGALRRLFSAAVQIDNPITWC